VILLAGFLEVLFKGFLFIGLALSIGGLVFCSLVLRKAKSTQLQRALSLINLGAVVIVISQAISLVVAPWALSDDNGSWPLADFLRTGFAQSGFARIGFSISLALCISLFRRNLKMKWFWGLAWIFATLVLVSGAFMVHGASRLENAKTLMTFTILHQLATAVWIGGTLHLVTQWRFLKTQDYKKEVWPSILSLFSPVALISVIFLTSFGLYLAFQFISDFRGLVGTAYGTMLLTKIFLMSFALFLGGLNFFTIRKWKLTGDPDELLLRTPQIIETEAGIGLIIFLAAAAFTAQPPAIDVLAQRASPREVLYVFAPKFPQLTPVSFASLNENVKSEIDPYAVATPLDKIQSNFNHNISGIFVVLIGLGALFHQLSFPKLARHWPIIFIPFWLFLTIFAQPTGWPLGNRGFIESLFAADVLQHRLGTFLVAILGIFEWRVQNGTLNSTQWRYLFPVLCFLGGALLLSHSHSLFPDKTAYLIEVSHNAIGILAVLVGAGRWLELRAPGQTGRTAGVVWPISFTLVGLVLLFYQEV
jgi:putative copper resistance protein D